MFDFFSNNLVRRGWLVAVVGFAPMGCQADPLQTRDASAIAAEQKKDEEALKFLFGIVTIPLLPVRLVDAIADGAQGVKDMGAASQELVAVAEQMPRTVRDELKLAVDDTLGREEVRSAVASFAAVSRSTERLAFVAETLPQTLAEQSQQLDASLARAERVTASVEQATHGFADAGRAWQGTIEALNKTLTLMQASEQRSATSATDASESSFDMAEVVQATEHLATTARELRGMIEQANALVGSDALRQRLDQVNHGAQQTVRATTGSASLFTDKVQWRLIQLAVVIFLLAILWRVICCELNRREHACEA
jgi:hypothetical protein